MKTGDLTWQDVQALVLLTDSVARHAWFQGKKLHGQELYEKVLKEFLESKEDTAEEVEENKSKPLFDIGDVVEFNGGTYKITGVEGPGYLVEALTGCPEYTAISFKAPLKKVM